MSSGAYIYGIMEEPQSRKFNYSGVGGSNVYTINYQQLAAAVSDTGLSEVDPTRKNVQAHTVVQETLMKEYTLLPMSYGMIAAGPAEVLALLENNYEGLLGELRRLDGKIEVELKVFWEQEAIMKEIQGESPEFSRLKAKVNAASSGLEVRNLMIEAGKLVESMVQGWKTKYAEQVYANLQALSVEAKVNNPVGIKNLLNASFLIEKSSESEFREQVYGLDVKYQDRMNFKYVGPLPPYNFINLKLEPVKC